MAPRSPTLEEKRAYYAKVRAVNYAASLRLEGFVMPPSSKDKESSEKAHPPERPSVKTPSPG